MGELVGGRIMGYRLAPGPAAFDILIQSPRPETPAPSERRQKRGGPDRQHGERQRQRPWREARAGASAAAAAGAGPPLGRKQGRSGPNDGHSKCVPESKQGRPRPERPKKSPPAAGPSSGTGPSVPAAPRPGLATLAAAAPPAADAAAAPAAAGPAAAAAAPAVAGTLGPASAAEGAAVAAASSGAAAVGPPTGAPVAPEAVAQLALLPAVSAPAAGATEEELSISACLAYAAVEAAAGLLGFSPAEADRACLAVWSQTQLAPPPALRSLACRRFLFMRYSRLQAACAGGQLEVARDAVRRLVLEAGPHLQTTDAALT
jgi:hypothetical protein